jgi:hypothetical protein
VLILLYYNTRYDKISPLLLRNQRKVVRSIVSSKRGKKSQTKLGDSENVLEFRNVGDVVEDDNLTIIDLNKDISRTSDNVIVEISPEDDDEKNQTLDIQGLIDQMNEAGISGTPKEVRLFKFN